jgi:hypothetical protein
MSARKKHAAPGGGALGIWQGFSAVDNPRGGGEVIGLKSSIVEQARLEIYDSNQPAF